MNEQSYDKIAEWFVNYRSQSKISEHIFDFVNRLEKQSSILDVGCGGGLPIAKFLVEQKFQVTGIDISEKMIGLAKENVPQGEFCKADICSYKTDKKFAGIVAWDSLFHLKFNQQKNVFEKLYNFLEPNGLMIFTHGAGEGGEIEGEMQGEKFSYSALGTEETKQFLQKIGFTIEKYEIDSSEPYLISLVRKRKSLTLKINYEHQLQLAERFG